MSMKDAAPRCPCAQSCVGGGARRAVPACLGVPNVGHHVALLLRTMARARTACDAWNGLAGNSYTSLRGGRTLNAELGAQAAVQLRDASHIRHSARRAAHLSAHDTLPGQRRRMLAPVRAHSSCS
jgi:hypothetical protein